MNDDAECLRRYAELRDESAFAEFVGRNIDLVFSAAFRQTAGDLHLAEDIAQRVFANAAGKAAALSRHPVVAAWLYQATRYAGIDAIRSRRRQQVREMAFGEMIEMNSPEDPLAWEKISPELDKIVSSLGEGERAAVVLRFFGGKSYAEVGAQLGLSENAARMRVDRALEKLRSRLSRLGVTSSCAALGTLLAENGIVAAPASLAPAAVATALSVPTAVAGVGALAGTLQFMTSVKISLGVATLITLASITAAVFELNHARAADRALAEALAKPPAPPAPEPTPPPSVTPTKVPAPDAPSTGLAAGPSRASSPLAALMGVLTNPIVQKQTELQAKLRLDAQYGALFKSLNLPPAQIEQLKALLVEKQMVGFDSMVAAQQHGIDPTTDPKEFFRAVADAETTVDSQISALLGADGFRRFQDYQNSVPARNTAHLLGQALSYTATPLSDTQSESVIQTLTKYGTPPLPPNNPFAVFNGDLGMTELSADGLVAVQSVLTPAQVKALQDKIEEQLQLLQARKRMGR